MILPAYKPRIFSAKGFTLVELLVVMAVLAVLAAIVIAAVNPIEQIRRGRDARIKNDIGVISRALQAYYTTTASGGSPTYPNDTDKLDALITSQDLRRIPTYPYVGSYNLNYGAINSADPFGSCSNNCDRARVYGRVFSQRDIRNALAQTSDPDCAAALETDTFFWGWASFEGTPRHYCNNPPGFGV